MTILEFKLYHKLRKRHAFSALLCPRIRKAKKAVIYITAFFALVCHFLMSPSPVLLREYLALIRHATQAGLLFVQKSPFFYYCGSTTINQISKFIHTLNSNYNYG